MTDLKIGSLDVLTSLRCYNNALKSIDVTGATKLDELFCHTNQLTSLITDGATSLAKIVSYTNTSLTNLDLSTNTGLTQLWTYNCNLGYLNVANGNNSNMADWQFQISKNANLTCVQVDDVDYSAKTWTDKDPAATFSLKCKNTVSIAHLSTIKINIYPNPCTGKLNIEGVKLIKEVQVINAIGKEVYRISNPSQFIDIKHLNNGMYFMLIHSEKGLSSHKIQVKH